MILLISLIPPNPILLTNQNMSTITLFDASKNYISKALKCWANFRLSIPSKFPNQYSSLIFPWIPTSSLKKKMATMMASISPPHISPETNPSLSLFKNCQSMNHLKQIHSQSIRRGLAYNPIVNSKIIAYCCAREMGMCFIKFPNQTFSFGILWSSAITE